MSASAFLVEDEDSVEYSGSVTRNSRVLRSRVAAIHLSSPRFMRNPYSGALGHEMLILVTVSAVQVLVVLLLYCSPDFVSIASSAYIYIPSSPNKSSNTTNPLNYSAPKCLLDQLVFQAQS